MGSRVVLSLLCLSGLAPAVIIDQIAIIAGNSIIKDSDIQRDIRLTDFLNRTPLTLDLGARKAAAGRLVDQVFIRREIRIGDYPTATLDQADKQIASVVKKRFQTDAAYQAELARYGLTDADLQMHTQWQLTVLNFIDARFRPAAYVTDQEIESYYNQHKAALQKQYPGKTSLADLRDDVRTILVGDKINDAFFSWLDEQRKQTKIQYLEDTLR